MAKVRQRKRAMVDRIKMADRDGYDRFAS